MKKIQIVALILPVTILFCDCTSSKIASNYVDSKKISYLKEIKPIMENSCAPCHIPPQGRKEPLENYEHVKENIGAIINRVTLPQDNRKFMPPLNKKPALTEAEVTVLVKWQQQNMPE